MLQWGCGSGRPSKEETGEQLLRVEFQDVGWRNGVLISESGYHVGTETGVLYSVNRDGTMTNTSIGDGKIRHAPIETQHGLLIHLQTATGSTLYLNNSALENYGFSPALPLQQTRCENRPSSW